MTAKKVQGKGENKDDMDYAEKLDKIIEDLGLEMDPINKPETEIKTRSIERTGTSTIKADMIQSTDTRKITPEAYEETKDELEPKYTPVYVSTKSIERMVGYGMRFANDTTDMKKWREVYGILIGTVDDEMLTVVKDAIPVCVGGKTGVELEPIHYVDLSQIDASIYERGIEDKKKDFIIGWWHTHPGFGFFFSEVDTYTHLGYQIPNPYAVGLIFDHCEKKEDSLGIAGLRLTDPEQGLLSDYRICELHYDDDIEIINKKIEKVIKEVNHKIEDVLEDLEYINNVLRKKALAQLQRNYGLIMVPKRDVKETDDEEEAEEDDDKLYVWDPDYYTKKYRIPKFREKVEEELKTAEKDLEKFEQKQQLTKLEAKKNKYKKKLQKLLEKPNEKLDRLLDEYNERITRIYELYDYLDTNERKILENFEEKLATYAAILEGLNDRASFKQYEVRMSVAE